MKKCFLSIHTPSPSTLPHWWNWWGWWIAGCGVNSANSRPASAKVATRKETKGSRYLVPRATSGRCRCNVPVSIDRQVTKLFPFFDNCEELHKCWKLCKNSQVECWKEQSAHRSSIYLQCIMNSLTQIQTKLAPPSQQQQPRRRRNSTRRGSPATSVQRDGGGKACLLYFNTSDTSRRFHEARAAPTKTPLTPTTQSRSGSY